MTQPAGVAVTGANGNLGRKVIAALIASGEHETIVGIDRSFEGFPVEDGRVQRVVADLADKADGRWRAAIEGVDAIVHFAARNPYPEATWEEAAVSFDMTAHLAEAAAKGRPRRFVFASSNHVMGGYKDNGYVDRPGELTTELPPLTGTRSMSEAGLIDSTPYATAKLMGERLLAAMATPAGLTAVSLRIGWCQPGANDPSTISATGTPKSGKSEETAEARRDYSWFRGMWLSNEDLTLAVRAALCADASSWPGPAIVVNAMSANAGMAWDLTQSERLIGYRPRSRVSAA